MHPRLQDRLNATRETRIQQLAASKRSLVERLEDLLGRLPDIPEDLPGFDHAKVKKALEISKQIISDADPMDPDRWVKMSPLLEATRKLVLEVGTVFSANPRQLSSTPTLQHQ